ncbi:nitrate/nitrite two-component system sensor histidine kinase NarX [Vibrio sp. S11_S32]|uniref:nitrate/nitrite two-component system sensor histidine kinase NarX n=1 Tax=Vibrio sp. S11_S32 TaxID=2720225 RepID=UPI0016816B59|nr:nitrate/nitrite two-component system sensor histidine kinase NarX [Vibrio sp. S11_S32]MBD1577383.1 nitrate/nitrite two-component system sensor histidine kinase NarX [Vibrio sp. S11_S32]
MKPNSTKINSVNAIWNPFSLVGKVSISMLVITLCAISGMVTSAWVANSIQGNAHAINRIGYMRMQSFELLSLLPLDEKKDEVLVAIEKSNHSVFLEKYIQERGFYKEYSQVHQYWLAKVKPSLFHANSPDEARQSITNYVGQLDQLVHLIDQETEHRLWVLKTLQTTFIIILLLLLALNIFYLKRRLFKPWRQLLTMAFSLKNGCFKTRYPVNNNKDEMNQLGIVLNSMADELEAMYLNLEGLVASKTEKLRYKNTILDFLYRSSEPLISDNAERYCALFVPILAELKSITGFQSISLEIEDYHQSGSCQVISTEQKVRPNDCMDSQCNACLVDKERVNLLHPYKLSDALVWPLDDGLHRYGALKIELRADQNMTDAEQQLIDTLSRQITRSLASKYQEHLNGELMLANERATIARELHDSIAQSLSCMKIRLSCLQMQSSQFSDEQKDLVKEMRHEVDVAYTQLRHLLATFRLKLTEPGLLPALENTIEEFNQKLGIEINLEFEIPANSISSHQAVHIVHIVREALSNVYKHANANNVQIDAKYNANTQKVNIAVVDDGCGMQHIVEPKNHYGLTIMRDRAKSLPGQLNIKSRPDEGTHINIEFSPQ